MTKVIMQELITQFVESPKWIVYPPNGMPSLSNDTLAPKISIPEEILQFYELCGGLESVIQNDEDLFLSIGAANKFTWAVKKILSNTYVREYKALKDDMAWNWYVIGSSGTDKYFVVDPAPERFGHCYFTELYFFTQPGWTPVVAKSFQGLLRQFLKAVNVGENWSWENTGLGDAYQ